MGLISKRNLRDIEASKWSGGTTTELFRESIPFKVYDKDYLVRISTATIDPGESKFSDFSGFNRALLILEGNVQLKHYSDYFNLEKDIIHYFSGGISTFSKSSDKVVDFNVITLASKFGLKTNTSILEKCEVLGGNYKTVIYSPYTEGNLGVEFLTENRKENITLEVGDILVIENLSKIKIDEKIIVVKIDKK